VQAVTADTHGYIANFNSHQVTLTQHKLPSLRMSGSYGGVCNLLREQHAPPRTAADTADNVDADSAAIAPTVRRRHQHQIVSLGGHCLAALYLKKFTLRDCSYPLDWMVSNVDMLTHMLRDGFRTFMDNPTFYCTYAWTSTRVFQHHDIALATTTDYHIRCVRRFEALRDTDVSFVLTITDNASFRHLEYTLENFTTLVALLRAKFGIRASLLVLYFTPLPPPSSMTTAAELVENVEVLHMDGARVTHALVTPDVEERLRRVFHALRLDIEE
jgi:hypothetical protein